jgi:hypothetical protein
MHVKRFIWSAGRRLMVAIIGRNILLKCIVALDGIQS